MTVTPIYAALVALVFLALSFRVIGARRSGKVSLGDGDGENKTLRRRIRAHGNCAEYAPIGLILLALLELQSVPTWALHLLGLALLAGRVLHGIALSGTSQWILGRMSGMILTLVMLGISALWLLFTTF